MVGVVHHIINSNFRPEHTRIQLALVVLEQSLVGRLQQMVQPVQRQRLGWRLVVEAVVGALHPVVQELLVLLTVVDTLFYY